MFKDAEDKESRIRKKLNNFETSNQNKNKTNKLEI